MTISSGAHMTLQGVKRLKQNKMIAKIKGTDAALLNWLIVVFCDIFYN